MGISFTAPEEMVRLKCLSVRMLVVVYLPLTHVAVVIIVQCSRKHAFTKNIEPLFRLIQAMSVWPPSSSTRPHLLHHEGIRQSH